MFCIYEYDSIAKLDSMCWFSHRHSRAREDCSQQNRTQAAVNVHCRHPVTPWRPHNGLVCCCVQCTTYSARIALPCNVSGDDSAFFRFFLCLVTLTFDLDIRTQARFLYSAPNHQVSSSYVESLGSYHANKQTNRRHWKHPPHFAALRRWVMSNARW